MSEDYPYRKFMVWGHMPEEDWQAAVQLLGQAGLRVTESFPPPYQPSAEALAGFDFPDDDEFVNKAHFMHYAADEDIAANIAGRSWHVLVELYDAFVYSGYYATHRGWERPPANPIRFRAPTPVDCYGEGHDVWCGNLKGLSMSSLDALLREVEQATSAGGNERAAIAQVLGPKTGPSVVQFLRGFAETWQPADA